MDLRDVCVFLAGVLAVKWWQWTTSKDRPQSWQQEVMRRKAIKAWLTHRIRMSDERASRLADKWPRAWL
jgi:nicotinamide riboside transporter PnuC